MDGQALVLAVGCYDTAPDALADLRELTNPGPTSEVLAGAALLHRDERSILEHPEGGTVAFCTGTGGALGVLVGVLFFQLPLLGGVIGLAVGALVGRHRARHEADAFTALLADDVPAGSVALLVVVPDQYAAEVRWGMGRALRTTGRTLDDDWTRKLARGLVRGDPVATEELDEDS